MTLWQSDFNNLMNKFRNLGMVKKSQKFGRYFSTYFISSRICTGNTAITNLSAGDDFLTARKRPVISTSRPNLSPWILLTLSSWSISCRVWITSDLFPSHENLLFEFHLKVTCMPWLASRASSISLTEHYYDQIKSLKLHEVL